MISGIYAIINKINNKRYIGSSVDIASRWRQHRYRLRKGTHPARHLLNAWNKYGEINFDFVVLEECPVDCLLAKEQEYLDACFPEYNTNKFANGMLGFRFSDESKQRMSLIHTGFRHTEESKKKMSQIWSGKPRGKYSKERCRKISESHKGKAINENQARALELGRKSPSVETRKKISESQKGYVPSKETIEKLKIARRKRVITDETKIKTSLTMKAYWANKRGIVDA